MAIISIPAGLLFGTFELGQKGFHLQEMSETTGLVRTRLLGPPRWTVQMGPPQPGATAEQGGLWAGLIAALQGGVNVLAVYNPGRQIPLGTARGVTSLAGGAAAGATQISIGGGTAKPGDCFQIGTGLSSQFVVATSEGSTFGISPPIRKAFGGGTPVTCEKALLHCKLTSSAPSWSYQSGNLLMGGAVIDLIEYWEN